jgi:hypothetical protein
MFQVMMASSACGAAALMRADVDAGVRAAQPDTASDAASSRLPQLGTRLRARGAMRANCTETAHLSKNSADLRV